MNKPSSKSKKATSATSYNSKATASCAEDRFDPENPSTATITVNSYLAPGDWKSQLHKQNPPARVSNP